MKSEYRRANDKYKFLEEISKLPIHEANLKLIETYQNTKNRSLKEAARTKLGELNLGFIYDQVNKRRKKMDPKLNARIPREEFVNEAMMRILQYVPENYKPEKGKLTTYMTKCVDQAVNKVIEDTLWTVYIPRETNRDRFEISKIESKDYEEISLKTGITVRRVRKALEVPERVDVLDIENSDITYMGFDDPTVREVIERETSEKMKLILSSLNDRQFFVLSQHHGLGYGPDFNGYEYVREDKKPYRDIGELMGTSWQNAQQMEKRAFQKLAKREDIRQMAGH